ncbi:DNA (cytosine-5-)-methyltransferase [bacterium]|nr:DNA (cytosine-5-)-methyltransferase [bacterium]
MKRPLRVGTDCSGIEAPIVALRQLKIPFIHEFSSEIDKHCIATIRANFQPRIIFGDIMERDIRDVPDIDLYICGFPCQPFSTAGNREGERDPRGTVFYECLRVILHKKPMVFVLENVRGLVSIDGGETFKTILDSLRRLKIYDVQWKILNTADYGIPQSRKRVFIVGIRRDREKRPFQWPEPIPCRPLEEFVILENRKQPLPPHFYSSGMARIINERAIFINLGFTKHRHGNAHKICPCLTADKGKMYCLSQGRYMSVKEFLSLQGFPQSFKPHGSRTHSLRQAGNSMSVNVIFLILKIAMECVQ